MNRPYIEPIDLTRPVYDFSIQSWLIMSVQTALDFISMIRAENKLRLRMEEFDSKDGLQSIIDLAEKEGFSISERDLREAFKHDWAMRWFSQTDSSE